MTFAKRVRLILEIKGISQRDFSKMINVRESQLSKMLNNKRKPTMKEISMIVERLEIPYECIMGDVPFFDHLLDMRSLWY